MMTEEQKEKHRERARQYYKKHREEILEYKKAYYAANRELCVERNRRQVEKHRDQRRAYWKRWNEEHREQRREYNRSEKAHAAKRRWRLGQAKVNLVNWLKTTVKIAIKKARLRRKLLRTLKPFKGYLTTKIIRNGVIVDGLMFEIKNEKDLKAVRSLLWQFRAQQNAPHEFFAWMVRRPQVMFDNKRVVQTQRGPCTVTWPYNKEKIGE